MSILIAGDLAPIRRYESLFSKGKIDFIDKFILDEIKESDLFIVNLEVPLSGKKPLKANALPELIANPSVIKGMKELNVDICSLGNNHIMDAGIDGITTTFQYLGKNKIEYFGAGFNKVESNKLLIKKVKNKKIGFYSISNNEFSVATNDVAGANPEDLIAWYYNIPKFKSMVDFLIIFYHTGIDQNIYPTPYLQRKCKLLIDLGADFITCQHSHVTGTHEVYKGKEIFYGQGDFIFDYGVDIDDYRKYGSILKLEIIENELVCKPIYFKRNKTILKVLSGVEKKDFEENKKRESLNNINSDFIETNYINEINKRKALYMNLILSFGSKNILKVLNKLKISDRILNKSYSKFLLNIFQNDIHRNMFIRILQKKI